MFREVQRNLQTQTWKASHAWRDTHPAGSLLEFLLQQSCSPFFLLQGCDGFSPASYHPRPWYCVWHSRADTAWAGLTFWGAQLRGCPAFTASCKNISCLKPSMQIISAMAGDIPGSHNYPEVRSVRLKSDFQNVLFQPEIKPLSRTWKIHIIVHEHSFLAILNSPSFSSSYPSLVSS